jgi:cold shock CspA family protein
VPKPSRAASRKPAPTTAAGPAPRSGVPTTGKIVSMSFGARHGFIRVANHPTVFFHRSDVRQGTSFSDLAVGDTVHFELLEDAVSGPRALHVERRRRPTR